VSADLPARIGFDSNNILYVADALDAGKPAVIEDINENQANRWKKKRKKKKKLKKTADVSYS